MSRTLIIPRKPSNDVSGWQGDIHIVWESKVQVKLKEKKQSVGGSVLSPPATRVRQEGKRGRAESMGWKCYGILYWKKIISSIMNQGRNCAQYTKSQEGSGEVSFLGCSINKRAYSVVDSTGKHTCLLI